MRARNFGRALLTGPLDATALAAQIARYDAADAAIVTARVRAEASLNAALDRWESIYREVASGFDPAQLDPVAESRANIAYLTHWHYSRRQEWEREQARRLKSKPFIGPILGWMGRQWMKRSRIFEIRG